MTYADEPTPPDPLLDYGDPFIIWNETNAANDDGQAVADAARAEEDETADPEPVVTVIHLPEPAYLRVPTGNWSVETARTMCYQLGTDQFIRAADNRGPWFLIWSNQHGMWWSPEGRGYTSILERAGRYTLAQAVTAVRMATHDDTLVRHGYDDEGNKVTYQDERIVPDPSTLESYLWVLAMSERIGPSPEGHA